MKAEKIHKHLEQRLAPLQQRTLSSSADSAAYEMYFTDPPTQDGQVVQGPGWAPWLTLTKTGCLEFPPQIRHQSSSEAPGHHSLTVPYDLLY